MRVTDSERQSRGLFLISGDDDAQIIAAANALFAELAGDPPDEFASEIIREDDRGPLKELIQQTIEAIQTPPFMGGTKFVWLKNFTGFAAENSAKAKGGDDSMGIAALVRVLSAGVPEDVCVVLSGPGCDPKKPLAQLCAAQGEVRWFNKPDRRKKNWREEMAGVLQRTANAKGITLAFDAKEALLDALGSDTSLIDGELEKLSCHAGEGKTITAADVQELCGDYNEQPAWTINDLVGKRNLSETLQFMEGMLVRSKDVNGTCRPLFALLGRYFREMLQLRLFMAERRIGAPMALKNFLDGLSPDEKKNSTGMDNAIMKLNPWRAKFTAENAMNYTPDELIQAICLVRDASTEMNSGADPRVVLEHTLTAILQR